MKKTRSDILRDAAGLIDRGWTTGQYAMTAQGDPLKDFNDPRAAAWCIAGAVWRACVDAGLDSEGTEAKEIHRLVDHHVCSTCKGNVHTLGEWNDSWADDAREVSELLRLLAEFAEQPDDLEHGYELDRRTRALEAAALERKLARWKSEVWGLAPIAAEAG